MNSARTVKGNSDNIPVRYGLAAWYRYRRGITNVSGCSSWADMSGNSRPLLQATAANQPSIMSTGELLFDGTNDYLQATFTLIQPCTIYLLFRQPTWTSGDVIFDGATGTVKATQSSGTQGIVANAGSALSAGTAIGLDSYGVLSTVFNGTGSVYQSAGGGPSVTITGDAGAGNPGGITLGATQAPGNYANIGVREMAVYSVAHDAPTRLNILRYLSKIASSVGGVM